MIVRRRNRPVPMSAGTPNQMAGPVRRASRKLCTLHPFSRGSRLEAAGLACTLYEAEQLGNRDARAMISAMNGGWTRAEPGWVRYYGLGVAETSLRGA